MRDHVLLQAIARVNRPYEDNMGRKKPSGFILDFVGIFDNLEKALAFDSNDIEGVVNDIKLLKEQFKDMMEKATRDYLVLIKGKTGDKKVESVLEYFKDEKTRHDFYQFFKEIEEIYEILSPDAFLRPYIEDYDTLVRMYRILKEAYEPGVMVDREFTRKTAKLVQEYTKTEKIKSTLEVYEINEKTLQKIEESQASDTEKVFNLLKSIGNFVDLYGRHGPYLISIGDKAELIAQLYMQRQKTTQEALEELKNLIEEINQARKEQLEKGMPTEIFTIYWLMKKEGIDNPELSANKMRIIIEKYPHWKRSEIYEMEVRKELYGIFFEAGRQDIQEVNKSVEKMIKVLKEGS